MSILLIILQCVGAYFAMILLVYYILIRFEHVDDNVEAGWWAVFWPVFLPVTTIVMLVILAFRSVSSVAESRRNKVSMRKCK